MKELASGAAVAIVVFGTGPYVVGMLRGRIRPHAFTWLVWTVTTMIAFAGPLVANGGIGAAAAELRPHGLAPRAPPRHGRRIAWSTVRECPLELRLPARA